MIKNTIYIITIFVLVFFVTSCCKRENLQKNRLRFNENDLFVYKSNLGNYDTLVIDEIKSEFEYNGTSENFFCNGDEIYYEKIIYNYNNYTAHFYKDSLLYIKQENENSVSMGISYDHSADSFYVHHQTLYAQYNHTDNYIGVCFLEDSIYENTRVRKYTSPYLKQGPYIFYYNKQYGFLSYEYRTGEKYILLKYIPNN